MTSYKAKSWPTMLEKIECNKKWLIFCVTGSPWISKKYLYSFYRINGLNEKVTNI